VKTLNEEFLPEGLPHPLLWSRIDPLGPGLHSPKLLGDVGWDLEASRTVKLRPHEQADVPTNVRVKLPSNAWGEIRARSSIARRGLQVDAGTIDTGFTGELLVLVRNLGPGPVVIDEGDRVGQLVLHWAYRTVGVEQDFEHNPDRGEAGFGSTGR
jgi:dUTP pyrophosphatase